MNKVVISGSYGMTNLGDEAIVEVMIDDIISADQNVAITVLAWDRKHFLLAHDSCLSGKKVVAGQAFFVREQLKSLDKIIQILKSVWAIISCDLFIWGGGGLVRNDSFWLRAYLYPLRLAKLLRKRIVICSIGVDKITNQDVIGLVNKIISVDYFSVRDVQSKDNLLAACSTVNESDIHVIRDPAFRIGDIYGQPVKHLGHSAPVLGLNLSTWRADLSFEAQIRTFIPAVARALNSVFQQINFSLVYLPTSSRDNVFMDMLKKELRPELQITYPDSSSPRRFLESLRGLDAFIAMRLHAVILGSSVHDLPMLGILYDEKVETLVSEGRLEGFRSIDEVIRDPEALANSILDCFKFPAQHRVNLEQFKKNSEQIKDVLKKFLTH